MPASPLPTDVALAFFDAARRLSALTLLYGHGDALVALIFHDAPGPAVALPLLTAVATSLHERLADGPELSLLETSMPEHPAEAFVYAHATLRCSDLDGRIEVASLRVVSAERVARMCGITRDELARTEQLVTALHRPRGCAFAGVAEVRIETRRVAHQAA